MESNNRYHNKQMDVTAALQGISTPINELYNQITQAGWEPTKVKFDVSRGEYNAEAKNIHGETLFGIGPSDKVAVAKLLLAISRHNHIRSAAQEKIGMWQTNFVSDLKPIAEAYAKAPIYDPKAAGAFKALADDSVHRAQVLGQQVHIEVVDNPEPYANVQEMANDVHQKKHFFVSRANSEHPVWSVDQNVAFRTVHDILGHCVAGGDFGWNGENLACAAHFPLLSPIAQQALFTECIAQTAYGAYYRSFGPQKVALFPEFTEGPTAQNNPPGHTGIHPSQSVAPVAMPGVPPSPPADTPNQPGSIAPHQEALGLTPVLTRTGATLTDPNAGWESGIQPMTVEREGVGNAYLDHGDPLQGQAVMQNAQKIDTKWHSLTDGSGEPDYERMKQAIVNAFRSVLLSPRKDLRWNAVHYQDLMNVPSGTDDPKVYWDTLEHARQEWNVQRYGEAARFAHMPYAPLLTPFKAIIYQQDPTLGPERANEKADRLIQQWLTEAHSAALVADEAKPESKRASGDEIERQANKILTQRLKMFIKERQQKMDFHAADEQMGLELGDEQIAPRDVSKYGAFMGTHLKSISQISQHVDELLKAALEDVREHDGTGHHFRSKVMQLNIAGVGPKVASFAWLLLQPMTSQLATIDTHMMGALGHNYDKEMNNRDYFKYERELQAGRDAAGYSHVPLGGFQWGMWDLKRNGPGSHQDHSALRVLDPTPHSSVDWLAKQQNVRGDTGQGDNWIDNAPDWWQNTEPARQQVAADWDEQVAPNFPQNQYPFQVTASKFAYPKIFSGKYEWPRVSQEKTAGKDEHSFSYWWNDKKPFDITDAKVIAEYAVATKTSKSDAESFLSEHRSDINADFSKFKKNFFKKFDAIKYQVSHISAVVPWLQREDLKQPGRPGQTLMQHIVEKTGLSTPEIWEKYEDGDVWKEDSGVKTAGIFDPLKKIQDRMYPQCPCGRDATRVYDLSDGRKLPVCDQHIERVESPETQGQMLQYAK